MPASCTRIPPSSPVSTFASPREGVRCGGHTFGHANLCSRMNFVAGHARWLGAGCESFPTATLKHTHNFLQGAIAVAASERAAGVLLPGPKQSGFNFERVQSMSIRHSNSCKKDEL